MRYRFVGFILFPVFMVLSACEHRGEEITSFTGDYRVRDGIAEFYDCDTKERYFVHDSSAHDAIIQAYQSLGLDGKEDVYIKAKGYLKEFERIEGLNPVTEFVPAKLLAMQPDRGCKPPMRRGG